uniref:Transmembrane protein n=1 Tax=Brassica oleracea TaxID=3712 RepID=A0A3P6CGT4_BRAOL|nr:unnamed protein product [Brassica oleracea]
MWDHYDSPCWAEGEAIFRHGETFTDVMKLFMIVVLYILQIVITREIYVIENIVWIPWLWWVQSMMVKISIKFSFMKQFKKYNI